jgi:acetyl-CoA synthetase
VVGFPHEVKGQGVYAFVTLNDGAEFTDELAKELKALVAAEVGGLARPDVVQPAPALPKTRSGKIMRRILTKIAADNFDEMGDTSTLAEPAVVDDLIAYRKTIN